MAFLCPVRMRRSKKKATNADIERDLPHPGGVSLGLNHGMGRITGSSSIETLVRVGIEKEHGLSPDSKMVVLHDFTPCVDDELEVKRGQIVNILYRENDWVYVIGQDTRQEGFIPFSYCAPFNTQLAELAIKKKLPREQSISNVVGGGELHSDCIPLLGAVESNKLELIEEVAGVGGSGSSTSLKNSEVSLTSEPECMPFTKDPSGRYIVLYTFIARDENDMSVERGEFVTVLNRDDPDWFWILRSDGQEGFIPSAFVYPADSVLQTQHKITAIKILAACAANRANNNDSGGINKTAPSVAMEINGTTHGGNLNTLGQPTLNANQLDSACVNGLQQQQQQSQSVQQQQQNAQQQLGIGADDLRYHGTELVMLYDYKAQAPDDLSVRRGDWIYADLSNQTVDGWLWSYAPKTRKYGFIPKAYARPPAMTSL